MSLNRALHRVRGTLAAFLVGLVSVCDVSAQQAPPRFGGAYAALDARRQQLVNDWVVRFAETTGQKLPAGPFYDDLLSLSTKTTFEAVTHALLMIQLTDRAGGSLGDALAIIERVESVRGEVAGAPGDRQFRMYVRLTAGAVDLLTRSQEFARGPDNTVYHKGFPISYREQNGVPSVQVSIALDGRRADVDVDYRSSSFPAAVFNGHLTSSNSDVRAGNNYDRHINRWSGFQNWWGGFFGVRQGGPTEDAPSNKQFAIPRVPRIGKKDVDLMVHDFLTAWLVEGDIMASMGYVSERSYACLAQDRENPSDFDRGQAPFQLMGNLKAAHDSLGSHGSLDGLVVGTRLSAPGLRVVEQPHHAQFVVYAVPDDVAAAFDCESQLTLGDPGKAKRKYGNYFGATFFINGRRDSPVALLWAKDNGYWKIVSWKVGVDDAAAPAAAAMADPAIVSVSADTSLVKAGRDFLESWLVRKDPDAAFAYLSTKAYGCYDLERSPEQPASTSPEDAGRKLRAGLEASARTLGTSRRLEAILSAVEPFHPAIRVMQHPFARVFGLSSIPNALADAAECAARASGSRIPDPLPLEYGNGFEMTVRFQTESGDAPVLRLLWRKENAAWRITSYGIELP